MRGLGRGRGRGLGGLGVPRGPEHAAQRAPGGQGLEQVHGEGHVVVVAADVLRGPGLAALPARGRRAPSR